MDKKHRTLPGTAPPPDSTFANCGCHSRALGAFPLSPDRNRLRVGEWLREPGNEEKSPEEAEAALGLEKLDARPAVEAALRIVNANPTDDLGFLALSFAY